MIMFLYYNNFFTIYNDIKFYKFYVHNRMANTVPRSYFISAIERNIVQFQKLIRTHPIDFTRNGKSVNNRQQVFSVLY